MIWPIYKVTGSSESVFKRAIGYSYQQVVLECVRAPTTQMASEKVADTVATFWVID